MSRGTLVNHEMKFMITICYKCASKESITWFVENLSEYDHKDLIMGKKINRKFVTHNINQEVFKNYFKVVIVRNPYHRLVSGFLDRGLRIKTPLIKLCEGVVPITELTFEKFVYLISKQEPKDMNGHWRQLSEDIDPKDYDNVVQLENITEIMDKVTNDFNFTVYPIRDDNKLSEEMTTISKMFIKKTGSDDKVVKHSTDLSKVPLSELKNYPYRIQKNYKSYLTPNLIEKIKEIYKNDFDLFGYNSNHP